MKMSLIAAVAIMDHNIYVNSFIKNEKILDELKKEAEDKKIISSYIDKKYREKQLKYIAG